MKTIAFTLAAALALAAPALAQTVPAPDTSPSAADQAVIKYMIADSIGEIQLCNLALAKSQTPAIRTFAHRMIADHRQNLAAASALAKSTSVPDVKMQPSEEAQIAYAHLSKYSGKMFDENFLQQNRSDHMADIENVRHAMEAAQSSAVSRFEQRTLSMLEQHLKLVESTNDAIAKS